MILPWSREQHVGASTRVPGPGLVPHAEPYGPGAAGLHRRVVAHGDHADAAGPRAPMKLLEREEDVGVGEEVGHRAVAGDHRVEGPAAAVSPRLLTLPVRRRTLVQLF